LGVGLEFGHGGSVAADHLMDNHRVRFVAGEVFKAGANIASGIDPMATGAVNFKDGMAAIRVSEPITLAFKGKNGLNIGVGVAEEIKASTQKGDRHEHKHDYFFWQLWGKVQWGWGGVGHGGQLNGKTARSAKQK